MNNRTYPREVMEKEIQKYKETIQNTAMEKSIDDDLFAMCSILTDELSELPQEKKIMFMKAILLDLMDYTEQTPDEKLWCEMYELFKKEKL